MSRAAHLALTAMLASTLVACGGSIRVVVMDESGGLLELEGDDAQAREAAVRQMTSHCGAEYRVTFDGEATVRVGISDPAPSQEESARRMALPSDLPGAVENAGTEPTGGSSIDDRGELHLASASDGAREPTPTFDRRRRIEYECEGADEGEIDEDGDGVVDD
jgi:hypothetical protein